MNIPDDLLYTKEHEWLRIDGDVAEVGITDYAQSELGDIVYIELPGSDRSIKKDETIGTIEAVKTVADLFAPVSGRIIETNPDISEDPEIVNKDPYGKGWILKIKMDDPGETEGLMDSNAYKDLIARE